MVRRALAPVLVAALLAASAVAAPGPSTASAPASAALYGPPTGKPSTTIPRVRPMGSAPAEWSQAPFYFIQTELSPATLYHSTTRSLAFFARMKDAGLGGPTFAACATAAGPRIVRPGGSLNAAAMSECWVLAWFAGAEGWTEWDSPWLVCLQHKPAAVTFDAGGLAFQFAGPAGYAALMPLYGYYKPPQKGKEYLAAHGLPSKNIKTWEWSAGLPAEVLARVRWWASVLREFPVYCEDTFSVDRAADTVTLRQRFEFISIGDDWKTPHVKFAAVSPPLAQAAMDPRFPVAFSRPLKNPDLFTPYGPYAGVENADGYHAVFRVLQYVNEAEASDPPGPSAHPTVQAALDRLRATARGKFKSADTYNYDHGGLNNFCWAIQGDQWYAKALPYYDDPTRAVAVGSLKKYFHDDVLVAARFKEREFPRGSGRTYLILEGPGIGSWGVLGDAGKFSSNLLETLWAYAHFTGDWALLKERWPMVKRLFCTPPETRWVTFGREAIAEMGDEAAPCLAMARMGYKTGDMDTYGYGCYMFAWELVHHWLKSRGAESFRRNQPWHSMEFMPEEVYLTNFWGDTAAWQIDGPAYPEKTGERQFTNRWVRFKNEDVARFYRDFLLDDVRKELDLLTGRWEPKRRTQNESHIMPSLVQLRSLLLNESPADLAKVATPERFGGPASGVIASCLAVLRTSRPTRFERLIPPGEPAPFVAGLERENAGPSTYLAQAVQHQVTDKKARTSTPTWPLVTWWGWKRPNGGDRWIFGSVLPVADGAPKDAKAVPLNWNTVAVTYTLP